MDLSLEGKLNLRKESSGARDAPQSMLECMSWRDATALPITQTGYFFVEGKDSRLRTERQIKEES